MQNLFYINNFEFNIIELPLKQFVPIRCYKVRINEIKIMKNNKEICKIPLNIYIYIKEKMKEKMRELLTQGVSIYIGYVWFMENLRKKKYKGKL